MNPRLPQRVAVVALGGIVGATARWATQVHIGTRTFPWELVIVNIVGSFVLGMVAFRVTTGAREWLRLGVGVGFCGGLTTFSSFAVDTAEMLGDQRWSASTSFLTLTTAGAVIALVIGVQLRHRIDPEGTA